MAESLAVSTKELVGNETMVKRLKANDFVDEKFGKPTIDDILAELAKPGRDPRRKFQAVKFDESVNEISDLRNGMILAGSNHECHEVWRIRRYWCPPGWIGSHFRNGEPFYR